MESIIEDSIQAAAMVPEEGADSLLAPRLRVTAEVVEAFGPALTDRVAAYAAALEAVIRGEKSAEEAFVEADTTIQNCLDENA